MAPVRPSSSLLSISTSQPVAVVICCLPAVVSRSSDGSCGQHNAPVFYSPIIITVQGSTCRFGSQNLDALGVINAEILAHELESPEAEDDLVDDILRNWASLIGLLFGVLGIV
jgi:hypothetical protein